MSGRLLKSMAQHDAVDDIAYGFESWHSGHVLAENCEWCGAALGHAHEEGCQGGECAKCGEPNIFCECKWRDDYPELWQAAALGKHRHTMHHKSGHR